MNKLETAINAAVNAGDLLMENYGKVYETKNKESIRDVVSEIDKLSEDRVISLLRESDPLCSILTEESGMIGENKDEMWVVDALDGTVNYIHKIPFFCVSISYWKNQHPTLGVVYNPYSNEIFYAEEGVGSFVNQTRLKVTNSDLNTGVSAMAFSGKAHNPKMRPAEFKLFGELNDLSQGCLRTGSAAMNLSYVASGKFILVVGKANKLWDVAAGMIIAKEAGSDLKFNIIDREKFLVDYICSSTSKNILLSEVDMSYINV